MMFAEEYFDVCGVQLNTSAKVAVEILKPLNDTLQ